LFYIIFINMKFKNLLTESIIDTLKLSKEEKAILKTFNIVDDDKHTYSSGTFDLTDGEKILKVSDMTGMRDLDKLYTLYKFFKKYKDILFKDEMGEIQYGMLDVNDYEILDPLFLKYYYENFNDTTLLKVYGGEWKLGIMMDIEEQMSEEEYSIISYLVSDTLPQVTLFSGIFKGNQKGIGWDLISQDDDISVFIAEKIKKKGRYEEVLGSGVIDLPTPKNLSKSEMDKYFKELFSNLADSILEHMWIIEEFMNYKTNN
jgi:hypothetical protein